MKPAQLRRWMQKYGNLGVLMVAIYLGLRYLWLRRRTAIFLLLGALFTSLLCLRACHRKATPALPKPASPYAVAHPKADEMLRAAVKANDLIGTRAALTSGADPNCTVDAFGTPILMHAFLALDEREWYQVVSARKPNLAILQALIKHGANVNARCTANRTVLDLDREAWNGMEERREARRLLREAGAKTSKELDSENQQIGAP